VLVLSRKLLFYLNSDLNQELSFVGKLIKEHPKNYQVWEHRRIIVEKSRIYNNELHFTNELLSEDSKNYHPWQYRQWLLKTFSLWARELDYVDNMIEEDIRNNSAWNQRYFVISHTTRFTDEIIEQELDFVMSKIRLCIDNESSWNYLRGIARLRTERDDRIEHFCQQLYDLFKNNDNIHCPQYQSRFLLAYMVESIDAKCQDHNSPQEQQQLKTKLIELCEKLASNIDPIRRHYYQFIKSKYADRPLPTENIASPSSVV